MAANLSMGWRRGWCVVHGFYRNPVIDAAVRRQLESMAHVMFGGLIASNPRSGSPAELVAISPGELNHVFFADSGSVAVEVAIKMSLQARPGRTRLLTVRGGYHGDTFGAMAVCDPVDGMHAMFETALADHVFAGRPPRRLDAQYGAELEALFDRNAGNLAAAIVEPVVQGAGGMWFYDPAVLGLLRELCDRHGMLLVVDEIATGFGRTGEMFACQLAGVAPDIMCVGKALTGGYLTLAATVCTAAVARAITNGEGGALMHGPTYMANPLACAAALASIGLLRDGRWREEVARIQRGLTAGLAGARELPAVRDVRVLGAIGVIELAQPVDITAATAAAVQRGVWLRPFRDLVYTMPPYVTEDGDIDRITGAMVAAAAAADGVRE